MKKLLCIIIFLIGTVHAVIASPMSDEVAPLEVVPDSTVQQEETESPETPLPTEPSPPPKPSPTPEPSPPPKPSEESCIGECPAIDPPLGVYLPHVRCDKFCQCNRGEANVIPCPAGLQFNPKDLVCDWPESANCTGIGGIEPPVLIVV